MNQREAERWVREAVKAPYASELFELEVVSVTPGAVVLALAHQRQFEHLPGWFQGAITTAIGEYAASYAAATSAESGAANLTLSQVIHFVGPARGDRLIAEAKVIAPGRSITYARADIYVEEAGARRLCASLTLTMRHALPRA